MTIADNSVAYNDALFIQGPLDVNSAGTGVIDPFLSVGGGGNQAINKGYNTVDASAEFDTVTGGDRTRPLLLSGVPEVEISGEFYREFKLDINKAVGGNEFLALNQLKLFLTADPEITDYDYAGGTEFGAAATKVWDLGDAVILMDYSLESGSGASDVSFFVKSSVFATAEDCSYGSPDCVTWVVMWNEFGNYADSALYPNRTWENNDGFEEWGVVLRPVVDVEKTATGTYEERHDWDILKSVDPESQSAFAGDAVNWTWTIDIFETVTPGNYAAEGTITIVNPTGDANGPVPEDVPAELASVVDVIDQGGLETNAIVDCQVSFPYTLDAGKTLVCSYTATPPNADPGLNTATVTVEVPEQIGGGTDTYEATADLAFTATVVNDSATFSDPYLQIGDTVVTDPSSSNYPEGDVCSTDQADYGADGMYTVSIDNTAYLVDEEGTPYESTATTAYTCYLWDVSKTADGSYNNEYGWDINKTVEPESQSGFAGDTLSWTWTITWESFLVGETNHSVTGVITVTNPADIPLTVDVTDDLTGNFAATVTCNDGDGGTSLTIAASSSGTCDYSAAPSSQLAQNTATATRNGVSVSDTVNVNWVAGPDIGLDATISDSNNVDIPVDSQQPYEYTDSAECSTDTGDYDENGTYTGTAENTATITWTGGSDSSTANTSYDCYILNVTKDASTSFTRTWTWTIDKTGDQTSLLLTEGQLFLVNYEVTVDATSVDSNFAVSGNIAVHNPAPIDATLNGVADIVSPNITATVDCGVTFPYTLAAGDTLNCTYSTSLPDATDRTNTVTATLQNTPGDTTDFSFTANVSFASAQMTEIDECIDVNDTNVGFLGTVCAGDAPETFSYSVWFGTDGSSLPPDAIFVPLECGENIYVNVADFVTNDTGATGSDDHTVDATVDCFQGCTLTQGYWKTHSLYGPAPYDDAWLAIGPAGADTIFFLSGKTWYQVFWTPPAGNVYYNLAHQYMAARLNILNGASSTPAVDAAISFAENYFSTKTPSDKPTKAERNAILAAASTLDKYNNGLIGPGHCSE